MKRILAIVMALVLVLSALTACSSKSNENAPSGKDASASFDPSQVKTMGDAFAYEDDEQKQEACSETEYIFVFPVGDVYYRAIAELPKDVSDEIWAIARSQDRLERLAEEHPAAHVVPIPLDLTRHESFDTLDMLLESEEHSVQWLVNCAGFGTFGSYAEVGRLNSSNMVLLNCNAVVEACSVCLPHMVPGSRIVNLSSIAGLVPQPYLAVYSATKAFVYELSRMLDHELKGTGIRVMAVCPKFMRTGFLDNPGNFEAADAMCRIGFLDVRQVVRRAIALSVLGHARYVPGLDMQAAALAARLLPRRLLFAMEDLLFR